MSSYPPREELQVSAARMRDAMAARDLTPMQIAEHLGMRDRYGSAVHAWARGQHAPTPRFRQPLADLLGIDVAELVPAAWDATPGMKAASVMSANLDGKRARDRDQKRVRDRERKRAKRVQKLAQPGPAETALRTFKSDRQIMQDRPPPPNTSDVLSSTLRSDGTMRLKLDLTLPAEQGMRLVALLHEAIAKGGSRDGQAA